MRKEEFYRGALPQSLGPLEGTRVLEATTSFAGPMAGTVLADLGADVIKVDFPGTGEVIRQVGPFVPSSSKLESSAFHLSINRNKKCISLDLRTPEGRELFHQLAAQMDVVIENFKPGTMEKWGLGYPAIRQVRPNIVYVSISGYGQFGPNHPKPSYDAVGQATGGLMYVTGEADGPPTRAGYGMGDALAGWQGAIGALAALAHRSRTGEGQHVDISQQESVLYCSTWGIMGAANADFLWKRSGSGNPIVAPYNTYPCKDGEYVFVAVALDAHWARLCKLMGREDLIDDPRTRTVADRGKNRPFVDGVVAEWTRGLTVEEVVQRMDEAQLVVAPILNFRQILADPHLEEREMIASVDHPAAGPLKLFGVAAKFSRTPARVRTPAPMLGEHNEEVYCGLLDLGAERLMALKEKKVI
ncbi:MAG: CoA transferase [Nitrospinae bacterium]|nr:CoA transferase [Nitrospinota bacterium]